MSTDNTYVTIMSIVTANIPLFINFLTVTIGTIGGVCNLITFTALQLRRNACAFYLLCASIFQILSILFAIPTRMALDNFGINLEQRSILFCKLRYYFSIAMPKLVTYYMLLAIFDRCLATSSNAGIRAWSQLKIAHRLSITLLIIGFATASHVPVFYEIYNGTCQAPPGNAYTIFFAVYLILIVSFLPHMLMLIFSVKTMRNLRKARQRILPTITNAHNIRSKRLQSQLVLIIVLQVLVSSLLVLLRLGSYTYTFMTSGNLNKTTAELLAETFALRLGISFYYFSFAISFYVFTLTSKLFRETFVKRIVIFYQYCRRLRG